MVERLIPNQHAAGSSPACPATFHIMAFPGIPDPDEAGIDQVPAHLADVILAELADVLEYPASAHYSILQYCRLLMAANTVTNLTGAKDYERLIGDHVIDCIKAAKYMPGTACYMDWGSGGGFPGLIWASMYADKHFHLCERNGKKAAFLEEARMALEFMHIDVHARQGEEIGSKLDPQANWICARAVEPLPKFLRRLDKKSLKIRRLCLMAGPSWQADWAEIKENGSRWKLMDEHKYLLSEERGERFVLHFKRPK